MRAVVIDQVSAARVVAAAMCLGYDGDLAALPIEEPRWAEGPAAPVARFRNPALAPPSD
jgi:hypothetical protein